jgi:hypothetical protein
MKMQIPTHYVTLTDYPRLGLGHACDPGSFDTAVAEYEESMAQGYETGVFRVDPPEGGNAGMFIDVTEDATDYIARRLRASGQELPDWLLDKMDEPRPADPVAEATQRNIDEWKAEE